MVPCRQNMRLQEEMRRASDGKVGPFASLPALTVHEQCSVCAINNGRAARCNSPRLMQESSP